MTARDKYPIHLLCPDCGKSGNARVSETDGWTFMKGDRDRTVDQVPEGFVVVDHGTNHGEATIFRCDCGTLVEKH